MVEYASVVGSHYPKYCGAPYFTDGAIAHPLSVKIYSGHTAIYWRRWRWLLGEFVRGNPR
jgi:hypothetical protein